MNHYEILYLVPANLAEEELEQVKAAVKNLITKSEGKITQEDSLGKKKLAYPIKKVSQGYYLLYEFDLAGKALKKLNQELKITPKVLRHIIIKKAITEPSLVDKTKELLEAEPVAAAKAEKAEEKEKVKIEDLDKKLDEILDGDIL